MFACGPEHSCNRITKTLQGFETRFPGKQALWLEAMDLRLACCDRHRMTDASKEQIRALSKRYAANEDLWTFLGKWAERYDQEAKALRREGNPVLGDAYAELALMLYTQMARIASGRTRYSEHLDAVQLRMGEILLALGQQERAERVYEELLGRTPDSAEALYHLGGIYEGRGRWDAALRAWRKYSKGVEAGSDAWVEARYRIALAHSRMGNRREACEVLTMIRVLHPNAGDDKVRNKIRLLEKSACGHAGGPAGG